MWRASSAPFGAEDCRLWAPDKRGKDSDVVRNQRMESALGSAGKKWYGVGVQGRTGCAVEAGFGFALSLPAAVSLRVLLWWQPWYPTDGAGIAPWPTTLAS